MLSSALPGMEVEVLAGETDLLVSSCRAGLLTWNKVEECKVCEQCPDDT